MRIALTAFAFFFGMLAHAACLAPCSYGAEDAYAFDADGNIVEAANDIAYEAFRGCRTVTSSINLNVEWPDSILRATETCDGEWRNIVLEMNTSANVFNISCLAVQLDAFDEKRLSLGFDV